MKTKFCSYYQQDVVVSVHNCYGHCECLSCPTPQQECVSECSARVHPVRISAKSRKGKIFWRRNKCNECINTSLEYTSGILGIQR